MCGSLRLAPDRRFFLPYSLVWSVCDHSATRADMKTWFSQIQSQISHFTQTMNEYYAPSIDSPTQTSTHVNQMQPSISKLYLRTQHLICFIIQAIICIMSITIEEAWLSTVVCFNSQMQTVQSLVSTTFGATDLQMEG